MITIGRERREDQRPHERRVETMSVPKDHWQGLLSAARAVVDSWDGATPDIILAFPAAMDDLRGTLATIGIDNAAATVDARRK